MTSSHIPLMATVTVVVLACLTSGLRPLDRECCKQMKQSRVCAKQCRKLVKHPIPNNSSRRAESKLHRRLSNCLMSWTSFWRCTNASVSDVVVPTTSFPVARPTFPDVEAHRCCQEAATRRCQTACSRMSAYDRFLDDSSKVEYLVLHCGAPPSGPLWKCFLSAEPETALPAAVNKNATTNSPVNVLPADGAKLQCCSRAMSQQCQDLCAECFSHSAAPTQAWSIFQASCLIAPEELVLSKCIDDVAGVCKLGCNGLSYCQAFNNRPLQPFRYCKITADIAAQNQLTDWIDQGLPQPFSTFPLKDISQCQPAAWKALSCIFQLKPCHPEAHVSTICYSDCMWLVNQCGDKIRMRMNGLSSEDICTLITPFNDTCISLRDFIPSRGDDQSDLTYPCQPNPCKQGYVCEPNRECRLSQAGCIPFRCIRGCNTDVRSPFLIERGAWVKIGVTGKPDCSQLCQCGSDNSIQSCQPMVCGSVKRNCTVQGQVYEHGSIFTSVCSRCVCSDGQVTCSQHQNCSNSTSTYSLSCENVVCPIPVPSHCTGVIPPGQCCPICGSTISFLVGYQTVDGSGNKHQGLPADQVDEILRHLKRLVNTLECDVHGISSDAESLVISVQTTVNAPSPIQVRVCNAEAQRLVSFIESRSPIITSNPTLDKLMAPQMQESMVSDPSQAPGLDPGSSSDMTQSTRLSFILLLSLGLGVLIGR